MIALVQLPDGTSLERTEKALDKVFEITRKPPGVAGVVNIAGVSALDNSATLSSAGVAYVILKDWSERGKGEDLMSLFADLNAALGAIPEADILVMPPPPIQGLGNDAGFTMQVELRDGSFDMAKLQSVTNAIVANAKTQSALKMVRASFRSSVPQYRLEVDRVKTEALQVSLDQVFAALGGYLGSTYVNQFNQFGRVFQVYVQADWQPRLRLEDIENMFVRNKDGQMIPLGTLVTISPTVGPSLISLFNLYPTATIIGLPAQGVSSGQALTLMEEIARRTLPPGTGFMERDVLSGEARRQSDVHRIRAGAAARLSCARRSIRKLVRPDLGHPFGPALVHRTGLGALGAHGERAQQQSLRPDRARSADGAVGQKCDPHCGVRARAARRRQADPGCRDRGRAGALPSDRDDVTRLHPRRRAARARERRRRQRTRVDRHDGIHRADRVDLPGGAVRTTVLRGAAEVRGMAPETQH